MTSWPILTQRHLPLGGTVMTHTARPACLSESGHNQAQHWWRR
jgi:hypothetical protein